MQRVYLEHNSTTNLRPEASQAMLEAMDVLGNPCLLYTSPSPRDVEESRMPSSA